MIPPRALLIAEGECSPGLRDAVRTAFGSPAVAGSLAEARGRLRESDYEFVLCGVHLPDGNWLEVLNCLVRSGREADFLLCAARADERLRQQVLARGGAGVITRPESLGAFAGGRNLEVRQERDEREM